LACALGHKACRDNRSVLYQRVPKLFADLALARGDGRHARIMRTLTGAQLLILDDWGLDPLDAGARRDLYEILEERHGRRSTILTSQVPVDKWHEIIGSPTYHDNCTDNLAAAMRELGLVAPETPSPLNLFMNIPADSDDVARLFRNHVARCSDMMSPA